MAIRILPDNLINQIAAGEVVERPASVVKELVENSLDAGATQIVIDVIDGGRTEISIIDNGAGMNASDLKKSVTRHATSKLPTDDLLNINFMGFRGEALPSIASVSDMTIDTYNGADPNGWSLDCASGEIKPSAWNSGTRIKVRNLFAKTPARLKFLRSDRAEMMAIVDVVKKLAMSRGDVGFVLNNKWRFEKDQSLYDRIISVVGTDVRDNLIEISNISNSSGALSLSGYISKPTMRRASSVDQYLFVNGRVAKDKVLVGALRAAYMDVMSAREFPICALYLTVPQAEVDVNVSPAKTDVHFLEPSRVRGFIIRVLRDALAVPLNQTINNDFVNRIPVKELAPNNFVFNSNNSDSVTMDALFERKFDVPNSFVQDAPEKPIVQSQDYPLGYVIGQYGNKYILAQNNAGLIIVDQHAAHERIVYESLRNKTIKIQPLLTPIVINMRAEKLDAVMEIANELKSCGVLVDRFGESALAVFEKPADWDLDWDKLMHMIAEEVAVYGHSSALQEKLHLKLANYACHHSVRSGQKLDMNQMDALLRRVENMERAGQCNHGRPVYKIIPMCDLDNMFERI